MIEWLPATPYLFFTGKGGVGKTSTACAVAVALAEAGQRVLLVSTDPASNLDEVLGQKLGSSPDPIPVVPRLFAMNIDPEEAARQYRERVVGPYRGVLPVAAVASIEEQLSGACTVEIAAFDEFSKLLGDPDATREFDRVIFDTAPTGHTLRLLELPAAWTGFFGSNVGGTSCLGPLAGLQAQQKLYAASVKTLGDAARTAFVLVARPEMPTLVEAERTRCELAALGVRNMKVVVNGVFIATDASDSTARALEARSHQAIDQMPAGLASLRPVTTPLLGAPIVGIDDVKRFAGVLAGHRGTPSEAGQVEFQDTQKTFDDFSALVAALGAKERGVIMTMGKGGVGKTTVAASIAVELAHRGHQVLLTTTDPAAHVRDAVSGDVPRLRIARIDPAAETRAYTEHVLATAGANLDAQGRALLEEDLRSPCTEEIAVFQAFARVVQEGRDGFVVIDTAPTGHTLLLLDAAQAYHREVARTRGALPEAVRMLLPRLRDPDFTRVLIVTLAEATPVHEAAHLQADLRRAGIEAYAWIINQTLVGRRVTDPVLRSRQRSERRYLEEVEREHARRLVVLPWTATNGRRQATQAEVAEFDAMRRRRPRP